MESTINTIIKETRMFRDTFFSFLFVAIGLPSLDIV
jgi:hypothetical protein